MQPIFSGFRKLVDRRFVERLLPLPAHCRFQMGEVLPDFTLRDTDDRTHQLSSYRGKPVVLIFARVFTEKQYHPLRYPHLLALNRAYRQFEGLGASMLMVTGTTAAQSKRVRQALSLDLPLLVNSDCNVFRQYGTGQALGVSLPAQFVLDTQGRLRFQHLFSFAHTNATPERLLWAVRNL